MKLTSATIALTGSPTVVGPKVAGVEPLEADDAGIVP